MRSISKDRTNQMQQLLQERDESVGTDSSEESDGSGKGDDSEQGDGSEDKDNESDPLFSNDEEEEFSNKTRKVTKRKIFAFRF